MKKKIITYFCLTIFIFGLFLVIGRIGLATTQVESGALTNTVTIPAFSIAQVTPPGLVIEPVTKEKDPTYIDSQKVLKSVINNGVNMANVRVVFLGNLTKKINASKLDVEQKRDLTVKIDSHIASLQALSAKIKADTDLATAKSDVKSIYTGYRIYGVFAPQINLTKAIYLNQNFFNNLSAVFAQTQARIDQDTANCKNVTAKQAALDAAKTASIGIDTALNSALSSVSAMKPADYPTNSGAVITSVNQTNKDVRAKLINIRNSLIKANSWTATKCTRMQTCTNGQCADKCTDKTCTRVGQRTCTSGAASTYKTCAYNRLGCLVPVTGTCASGKVCSNGSCVVPTCTGFTYSDWTICNAYKYQTRTITAKTPANCTGGTPEAIRRACTPSATCTNACDPATYGTKCTAVATGAVSTGYTQCAKNDAGCYVAVNHSCGTNEYCLNGNCTPKTQCLATGAPGTSVSGLKCCDSTKSLKVNYDFGDLDWVWYDCCDANQCAMDGICADNGTTIPSSSNSAPTCINGTWITKQSSCLSEGQYSTNTGSQCCASPNTLSTLQLKQDYYGSSGGSNYPGVTCCYSSECAIGGKCVASGTYSPDQSKKCSNGTWVNSVTY